MFFKLLGGFEVFHRERIPTSGPVILAANHVSFADPPACAVASERPLRFMAQAELFKPPGFGHLISALGAFPIHRGEADSGAIRTALEILKSGGVLLVFPEGKRGDGKSLGSTQKGLILIAAKSGAPVVPIAICGSHHMLPKGRKLPRRSKVRVFVGSPLTYSSFEVEYGKAGAKEEFGKHLMARICDLLAEGGESYSLGTDMERVGSEKP